jgi:hypothetical protein
VARERANWGSTAGRGSGKDKWERWGAYSTEGGLEAKFDRRYLGRCQQVARGGQVRMETTCMVDGGKRESFVMHASLCPLFPTS